MSTNFPNAPLVELMAEIRWDVSEQTLSEPDDVSADMSFDGDFEPLYREFGQRLARIGFTRSERLVPQGYPAPSGLAIYSFSSPDQDADAVIFQVGPGVFTANAIPPYRSWETFRPELEMGLDVLLESFKEIRQPSAFTRVQLRYVNAFGEQFLLGSSKETFLREVLGFNLSIPTAFGPHLDDGDRNQFVQFASGLKSGGRISVRSGDATVENAEAVVMDTSITFREEILSTKVAVMTLLDSAHLIIHELFITVADGVRGVMEIERSA